MFLKRAILTVCVKYGGSDVAVQFDRNFLGF